MNFTNESIEINTLPKFEEVSLQTLQKSYFKVIALNLALVFVGIILGFSIFAYFNSEIFSNRVWLLLGVTIPVLFAVIFLYFNLSFKKRGFAFRTHDAIYKSGLLSETTTIVPFNRVQHVALHQGFISRRLGLASIELFTAGGSSSDLEIPGLLLEDAQKIKNLVSQKINETKSEPQEISIEEIPTNEEENEITH